MKANGMAILLMILIGATVAAGWDYVVRRRWRNGECVKIEVTDDPTVRMNVFCRQYPGRYDLTDYAELAASIEGDL